MYATRRLRHTHLLLVGKLTLTYMNGYGLFIFQKKRDNFIEASERNSIARKVTPMKSIA